METHVDAVNSDSAERQMPNAERQAPRLSVLLLWVLAIASAIYTAHVIQWSIRFGRLTMDPVYDDVGYFLDGLNRLDKFQTSGIRGLCDSLFREPPHSPYSTLAAMTAFDLFGVHEWAPYILNGMILFFLLVIAAEAIELPAGSTKLMIVLSLLMLQIPFQGILQFRPDFPLAVFTAACVILLLKEGCWPSQRFGTYRHFFLGLLGSCAIVTKPPFSPLTALLLVGAFGLAEFFRFTLNRKERALVPLLGRTLAFLGGVIILAGPFLILNWHEVAGYIAINTGAGRDASMWKGNGGFLGSLADRVRGWPVYLTFGPLATPFTMWLGLGLLTQLLFRRWRALLFNVGILILSATSLLGVAAVGMADPNFSLGWEVLFAIAVAASVGQIGRIRYGVIAVACYFAMTAFIFYKAGPPRQVWEVIDDAAKGHSLNQAVLNTISERTTPKPAQVFLTFIGGVNSASQEWLSVTQHLGIHITDLHRARNPEEVLSKAASADFVEVADPGSNWFASWIPINQSQALLLDRMRADRNFEEVQSFIGSGGTVYLFQRRSPSP